MLAIDTVLKIVSSAIHHRWRRSVGYSVMAKMRELGRWVRVGGRMMEYNGELIW